MVNILKPDWVVRFTSVAGMAFSLQFPGYWNDIPSWAKVLLLLVLFPVDWVVQPEITTTASNRDAILNNVTFFKIALLLIYSPQINIPIMAYCHIKISFTQVIVMFFTKIVRECKIGLVEEIQ